ncbi:TfuA-like protein [Streptomyces sp. NPDC056503]|uniref:TfuA-like protein n=1 Tax=Streptomyces sp. NPDC056503 TaxID=3345842 RepID=UPI0036B86C9B
MRRRGFALIGPSLAPADRPALPDVTYRPPARHGDLYALGLRRGDSVLVVDGLYQHVAPLRHKEILAALAQGVRVYGAASYGALRSAELADHGMVGVGRVAAAYRGGELASDADVAVLHSDDEACRPVTIALVSLRTAARALAEAGRIDPAAADEVIAIGAALHYTERAPGALRARAAAVGVGAATDLVLAELAAGRDVKRQDALEGLRRLGEDTGGIDPPPATRWDSSYGAETAFAHTPLVAGGVTGRRLLACLQVFAPDYPERHRAYVHRMARASSSTGPGAAPVLAAAGFDVPAVAAGRYAGRTRATGHWPREERALVRTFRLPPGRCVYKDLPPEALGGRPLADVLAWSAELGPPPPAGRRLTGAALAGLWGAANDEELLLSALERGFRDLGEAVAVGRTLDLSRGAAR